MSWQRVALLVVGLITVTVEGAKVTGTLYFRWKQPAEWSGGVAAVLILAWGPSLMFGILLIVVAALGHAALPLLWVAGAVLILAVPARCLVARRLRETAAK